MIRPLRGRVAIRPIVPMRTGLIWHPDQRPDTERAEDKSLGILAQSSHRGRVLAMGAPALRWGQELPHGFAVGDEVIYVFASGGIEKTRAGYFGEEPCVWVTQEEVLAVVTPDAREALMHEEAFA
jgi:co-chaperonin GroES (HSP10)